MEGNNEKKMEYYEVLLELLKGNQSDEVCQKISTAINKAMAYDIVMEEMKSNLDSFIEDKFGTEPTDDESKGGKA